MHPQGFAVWRQPSVFGSGRDQTPCSRWDSGFVRACGSGRRIGIGRPWHAVRRVGAPVLLRFALQPEITENHHGDDQPVRPATNRAATRRIRQGSLLAGGLRGHSHRSWGGAQGNMRFAWLRRSGLLFGGAAGCSVVKKNLRFFGLIKRI